jgi:hypothetical protein
MADSCISELRRHGYLLSRYLNAEGKRVYQPYPASMYQHHDL